MRPFQYIRDRWHPLHRLRKQVWFKRALPWIDFQVPARVGLTRPIYVRLITHAPFVLLGYRIEKGSFDVFEALVNDLPQDLAFYDIGANIGVYSFAACELRPDVFVLSVEPDPSLANLIRKTSRRWKLSHHQIFQAAASSGSGEASFEIDASTSATGQIVDPESESFQKRHFGTSGQHITVRTVSIDELAKQGMPPGLLKVDVEGHEIAVFEGAVVNLGAHRPTWIFESFAPKNVTVCAGLRKLGYLLWDLDQLGGVTEGSTNFLAIHPDRLSTGLRARLRTVGLAM